jgi:hypothetical protein
MPPPERLRKRADAGAGSKPSSVLECEGLGIVTAQDLWRLYGWSTFEALYNPLWAAGLALTLFYT